MSREQSLHVPREELRLGWQVESLLWSIAHAEKQARDGEPVTLTLDRAIREANDYVARMEEQHA